MNKFYDIGVSHNIINGLDKLGFTEPTPVQAKVIPLMLEHQSDMVSLAQTGTGKTAAFGIPLIQMADTEARHTQTLIICPTRELCAQVAGDLDAISFFIHGLKILAVYGGANIGDQIRALNKGVHILVATPGRLNDLIKRGKVDISKVRYVVLDEADEMLKMGFKDELNSILERTPPKKNTFLFSATMSREVTSIANGYMSKPIEITIGQKNAGAENVIHQFYVINSARGRYAVMKRIIDNYRNNYSIVFCRTKNEANDVAVKLIKDGYNADAIHGDLSQSQRINVMDKFKSKNLQILVATDVASRGLDVNDLSHVINYNLPDDIAGYIHRSGRTGRAGNHGISVSLITERERFKIRQIEKKIKKKFKSCAVPSGEEICRNRLLDLMDEISNVKVDETVFNLLDAEILKRFGDMDSVELVKRILSIKSGRLISDYKKAPDINIGSTQNRKVATKKEQKDIKKRKPATSQKNTCFFINAGRRQGVMPQWLMGRINSVKKTEKIKLDKIAIMRNNVLLEADSRFAAQILEAFQDVKLNGKTISIEVKKYSSAVNNYYGCQLNSGKGRKLKAA